MLATLRVVSEADYERWVNDRTEELKMAGLPPAQLGQRVFIEKGCNACHSLDGKTGIGPTFLNLFDAERNFTDGTSAVAEENYLRESILYPNAKIVQGYQPVMPAFEGQLSDAEIDGLIAFIRTVDGTTPIEELPIDEPAVPEVDPATLTAEERGKIIYDTKLCITCHSLDGTSGLVLRFKGLYGKRGRLVDGSEYVADDAYIRDSILNPASEIVEGYQPVMPPYAGQLSEQDIQDVIEYIKSVS
jgi:cytochrome c oxidase subunit II